MHPLGVKAGMALAFIEREERLEPLGEGVERLRQLVAQEVIPMLEFRRNIPLLGAPLQPGQTPLPPRSLLQRHSFLEIGVILEGAMGLWWRGHLTVCRAGSVVLIPPRCPHLPHVPLPQNLAHRVLWLIFPPHQCIAHQCAWRDGVHYVGTYCALDDDELIYLGRSLWREWRQQDEWSPLVVKGYLLALFGRMLKAPARPAIPKYERLMTPLPAQDPLVDAVYRFLWSNYNHPIRLKDLAAAIAYSPAYLCRHFRQKTGETPFQALRRIRLEVAKRLLSLNLSIATVAEMVGFNDPLYFSKVFTRTVGTPPTLYRQRFARSRR